MSLLSEADVKTVVSRALGPDVQIHTHSLEAFSKTKEGIMGSHHQLTVEVKVDSEMKKYTFFLKTYLEKSSLGDARMEKYSFEEEENFFDKVQPLMMRNYKGEKWSATCYLVKPGVLVFEDLRAQGYASQNDFGLDVRSVKAVLISLARFHACSLLAEAELGKSLKEAFPKSFEEKLFSQKFEVWKSNEVCLTTATLMAKKLDLDPTDLPKIFDYICRIILPRVGNVNVVNQGDLWKNNLMFNDGKSPECIIIDYQILRYASFGCDLGCVLQLNMEPAVRNDDSEMEMLKFYYEHFEDTLRQSDLKVRVPSFERMVKEYMEHRILGLWLSCIYYPFLCFTPREVMGLMGSPEGIDRWLYGDRFGIFEPYLDSKPEYAAIMKNTLSDLLNEGKRVLCQNDV